MSETVPAASESTVRESYCALIPHPAGPRAWLAPRGEAWALPAFVPEREIHNGELPHARRCVAAQLGVDLSVRYALRLFEPALPGALNLFVLERGGHDAPKGLGRWVGAAELAGLTLALPRQHAALEAWLAEEAGEALPSLALPWWQEGWLAAADAWLMQQAGQRGFEPVRPAERLRSAGTAAIVRLPARPADLYLKALPPFHGHEAPLLLRLAERHPEHLPVIEAVDGERGWVLMRDFGGRPLGSDTPVAEWERVARAYAQMQIAATGSVPEWLALGCPDLRLDQLTAEMERLFAAAPDYLRGLKNALSPEEHAALHARAGMFRDPAAALAEYVIPPSLEHGDLHAGNIRVGDEGPLFYDWSGACVTHPFFGLSDLIADDDWFPEQPEFNERMRDAYLEPWSFHAPMEALRAAYRLCQPVREVYIAFQQCRTIEQYQQRLGGRECIAETPSGNAVEYTQWWLAHQLRKLIRMEMKERSP
jgi:aminoglycoside phosphotransferase (APT) family kinase protein